MFPKAILSTSIPSQIAFSAPPHHKYMLTLCFSLTSVSLSVWSLMLMKACNSLSDSLVMTEALGLCVVAHGSTVVLWLCWMLQGLFLRGGGPKRLSSPRSLSLDSLDSSSGGLGVLVGCMLRETERDERTNSNIIRSCSSPSSA